MYNNNQPGQYAELGRYPAPPQHNMNLVAPPIQPPPVGQPAVYQPPLNMYAPPPAPPVLRDAQISFSKYDDIAMDAEIVPREPLINPQAAGAITVHTEHVNNTPALIDTAIDTSSIVSSKFKSLEFTNTSLEPKMVTDLEKSETNLSSIVKFTMVRDKNLENPIMRMANIEFTIYSEKKLDTSYLSSLVNGLGKIIDAGRIAESIPDEFGGILTNIYNSAMGSYMDNFKEDFNSAHEMIKPNLSGSLQAEYGEELAVYKRAMRVLIDTLEVTEVINTYKHKFLVPVLIYTPSYGGVELELKDIGVNVVKLPSNSMCYAINRICRKVGGLAIIVTNGKCYMMLSGKIAKLNIF